MHHRDHVTDANEAYHDAIAGHYDDRFEGRSDAVLEWVRGLFARDVFPALDAFEDKPRAIDFGCGSGYLEDFVAGREIDLLGIDISEGMLARARERFPQWRFDKEDLYDFQPDEQYHLVMENAVLHHLVDYEALVDKMASLTLPGGILYLGNEPNHRAYKYLKPVVRAYRSTVNRYRTETAVTELGDADFEALSEYHLFFGEGIDSRAISNRLSAHGFRRVEIHYSLRELFSALEEASPRVRLNTWTPDGIRDHFPLSRNFTLIAQR